MGGCDGSLLQQVHPAGICGVDETSNRYTAAIRVCDGYLLVLTLLANGALTLGRSWIRRTGR